VIAGAGQICPYAARKLASDFATFQAKVDERTDADFRASYADVRKAFELAAEEGAVLFH
jgi:hypothetical protein